jgi:hypothetical protein
MSVFCPCVSCVTVHWFVVCVCLRSKNSFNMSQSHIKFVLSFVSQSVMKFVPWIDIFLWQISQTTESQPNYNSLVLCLKIVCPSVCLSVYLVLSQVCVSMSKKWVVLFILWIDHMPPATLIPIFGIGRARHRSTFSSSFHFLWARSAPGTRVDQNFSGFNLPSGAARFGTFRPSGPGGNSTINFDIHANGR